MALIRTSLRASAARLYAGIVTLACLAGGTYLLAFAQPGVPVHLPRAMRFTTPCVSSAAAITQSFIVHADSMDAVTVFPAVTPSTTGSVATGPAKTGPAKAVADKTGTASTDTAATDAAATPAAATGLVAFELRSGDGSTLLQRVQADAASLAAAQGAGGFRIALPRVEPAGGRKFALRIETGPDVRGCVAFQATGIHMPGGDLFIGHRPQWGDLLLSVHASRGTRLHALQIWIGDRLGIAPPRIVLGALGIGYGLALGWLCHALITRAAA